MPEERSAGERRKISPELVEKVTEKVFALILADLKRQNERSNRRALPAQTRQHRR